MQTKNSRLAPAPCTVQGRGGLDETACSIEALELNTRAERCLLRAGIDTVEKLCNCTEEDLLRLRAFGKGTLNTTKLEMAKKGLFLKKY